MRRYRRGGFTLIEVLVVVVLVSLLLSGVMVNLDGRLPGTRTESAARGLLQTLDLARTSALAHGQPYVVLLDLDEERYTIRVPFDGEGTLVADPDRRELLPWTTMDGGATLLSIAVANKRKLETGVHEVEFRPGGSAREVYVHLGNEANDEYVLTVRLLALTGLATVLQGEQFPEEITDEDF